MPYTRKTSSREEPTYPKSAFETTPLGKILRVLGTGERIGTSLALRPLAEIFYPEARARIKALTGDTYAGDILRAIDPGISPVGAAIGGALVGGVVDPLSYLGIGGVTAAGKALAPTARAASRAAQAARGERDLLRLVNPLTGRGPTLVKGEPFYRAVDIARSGYAARKTIGQIPGLASTAKTLDDTFNSFGRWFNVPMGDPALHQLLKQFWSKLAGSKQLRTEDILNELAPERGRLAMYLSDKLGLPDAQAMDLTNRMSAEIIEQNKDYITRRAAGSRTFTFGPGGAEDPVEQIVRSFPLPPNLGGPASVLDHETVRLARNIRVTALRKLENISADQSREQLHKIRLWSSTNYLPRIATQEFIDALRAASGQRSLLRGIGTGGRPTAKQVFQITRNLRVVNPEVVEDYAQKGLIPEIVRWKVRRGRRTHDVEVPLLDALRKNAGQVPGRRTLAAINRLVDKGYWKDEVADVVGNLIPSMTVNQANDYIRDFGLLNFGIQPSQIKQAFHVDPVQIVAQRGVSADRAILSKQLFDEIKTKVDPMTGQPVLAVRKELQPTLPYAKTWVPVKGISEMSGYVVDPESARHLEMLNHADIYVTEHLHKFIRGFTKATQWWKAHVLALFPAFHFRNLISNGWQYYMGETGNPVTFARGLKDSAEYLTNLGMGGAARLDVGKENVQALKSVFKDAYDETTGTVEGRTFLREMVRRNAVGIGFISPDDPQSFQKLMKHYKYYNPRTVERQVLKEFKRGGFYKRWGGIVPPSTVAGKIKEGIAEQIGTDSRWVNLGFRVGQASDDWTRTAHILNRLRDGAHFDEAIASMKKHFYDYHDLSPIEREVFKTVFPFYSWSRKNIPYYLEALIRDPARLARFGGAYQGWTGNQNPQEEAYVSEWMRRNAPLRIRKRNGRYEYFLFKNWLPLADLQDVFNLWSAVRSNLNPFPRVLIELMANYNLYTDRKIDRFAQSVAEGGIKAIVSGGERTRYLGMNVPNKVVHAMNILRSANTLHQIIDDPREMGLMTNLVSLSVGRLYPLDTRISLIELKKDLEEIDSNLRRASFSAVRRGQGSQELARLIRIALSKRQQAIQGIRPELAEP